MKIGGVPINGPKRGLLVLPRDPDPLIFNFISVSDDSDFDKIYPPIKPRKEKNIRLNRIIELIDEPQYIEKVKEREIAQRAYIFLKSISPSNIEWETVDLNKPETFNNWQSDFRSAGLSNSEINAIFNKYVEVNVLTDDQLQEARDRFLALQAENQSLNQLLPPSESQFTESGELVNASI